jgi:hypothetical protein
MPADMAFAERAALALAGAPDMPEDVANPTRPTLAIDEVDEASTLWILPKRADFPAADAVLITQTSARDDREAFADAPIAEREENRTLAGWPPTDAFDAAA